MKSPIRQLAHAVPVATAAGTSVVLALFALHGGGEATRALPVAPSADQLAGVVAAPLAQSKVASHRQRRATALAPVLAAVVEGQSSLLAASSPRGKPVSNPHPLPHRPSPPAASPLPAPARVEAPNGAPIAAPATQTPAAPETPATTNGHGNGNGTAKGRAHGKGRAKGHDHSTPPGHATPAARAGSGNGQSNGVGGGREGKK
jgi:hypothetical protein